MSTNTRVNTPANRFRRTLAVFVLAMASLALLAACGDDEGQARQDQQIADLEAQVGKFDSQVMELETNLESARMEAGKFESQVMELETALEAARTQATASLTPLLAMLSQPPQPDEPPPPAVGPVLRVEPAIFNFPERKNGYGNVWFYGSGLEPGQWYTLSVRGEDGEQEVPLLGNPDNVRQANAVGAFAISVSRIDARPGRFDYAGLGIDQLARGGVFVLTLDDVDTGEVAAMTPWVVCGQARENPWCPSAKDTTVLPSDEDE